MKVGVIMSSELAKAGRWDAGFHLLNQEYKDAAAALAEVVDQAEAVQMLSDSDLFPTSVLLKLSPLCRGTVHGNAAREQLLKAVAEYPHLSLAIVLKEAEGSIREQQDALKVKQDKLAATHARLGVVAEGIRAISGRLEVQAKAEAVAPLVEGVIPGLLPIPDELAALLPTHRYVAGVVYRDGDELVIPVHTGVTEWVSDCWVIRVEEWSGVETIQELVADGNIPIPRRYEDVGTPVGYVELPGHEQNYGRGWR